MFFKGDKVALVVRDYPWKDRIGTEIIETPTAELVELEKELLILDLTFKPRIEKI